MACVADEIDEDRDLADALEAERLLVARAQTGDRDALRPLFERFADPLYAGVILPRLPDAAAAEDILRDTFLTAIEKIGGFTWQGRSLFAWLRQIALHKIIDVHRRRERTGRLLEALASEHAALAEGAPAVDEALAAAEERALVATRMRAALACVRERYREVLNLRLIEELPRDECARRLGVTLGHLDVLVFRALKALRREYGAADAGEGDGA